LVSQRRLSHEEGGRREATRLVQDDELRANIETVAPPIVNGVRHILRAIERITERPQFFLISVQPHKTTLQISQGNAWSRHNPAIIDRLLIHDAPLAFPAQARKKRDIHRVAAAYVIEVANERIHEIRAWIVPRRVVQVDRGRQVKCGVFGKVPPGSADPLRFAGKLVP